MVLRRRQIFPHIGYGSQARPIWGDCSEVKPGIVVMGASTGGPQALKEILVQLPADFPLPHCVRTTY